MISIFQELIKVAFKYGYNGQLYCNDWTIANNNNIDIIIANHPNAFYDIPCIISLLDKYNITRYTFIHMEWLSLIPGFNVLTKRHNQIIIKEDYGDNYNNIINGLTKIIKSNHKEFIIIYPEGDVLTINTIKARNNFVKANNLPILNNVLVPKTKGLYTIVEFLKKNNKLGTIHDFTIYNKINNYYIDIKKFEPKYNDYESFKKELYERWFDKEKLIEKMKDNMYEASKVFLRSRQMTILFIVSLIVFQTILLCNLKYLILFICKVIYFYF